MRYRKIWTGVFGLFLLTRLMEGRASARVADILCR
jgi:hypothetical protein